MHIEVVIYNALGDFTGMMELVEGVTREEAKEIITALSQRTNEIESLTLKTNMKTDHERVMIFPKKVLEGSVISFRVKES
jgi:hypothetical protein